VDFRNKVVMQLDAEVDAAYPAQWIGKVVVHTVDGRTLHGRVDEPKGDPGNTLSRPELQAKALSLGLYSGGATQTEMQALTTWVWQLAQVPVVGHLLG
jgi:2-methylcitrate dehydratase PrpD